MITLLTDPQTQKVPVRSLSHKWGGVRNRDVFFFFFLIEVRKKRPDNKSEDKKTEYATCFSNSNVAITFASTFVHSSVSVSRSSWNRKKTEDFFFKHQLIFEILVFFLFFYLESCFCTNVPLRLPILDGTMSRTLGGPKRLNTVLHGKEAPLC